MRTKRLFIFLILLSGLTFSLRAEKFCVQEKLFFKSSLLKQDINYSIVLPTDYFESGKSYPVIYFLHGLGDDQSSWLEYGEVAQYMERMVKQGIISPFIAVMPQGFKSYYSNFYTGDFPYQDMFVNELVPFIDKQYRTITSADKRAVMGYSMGGFGALILPIKYPDIFSVSIPLSASIRTDIQYVNEDQKGWDQQWGKIFGAEGKIDSRRITAYYKQNSPYHLIKSKKLEDLKRVSFFIENGDKENTLCRSNEELHMLMLERNIPHIYNVRNGGHEFQFWRESIPEAFRFADCNFNKKPYVVIDTYNSEVPTEKQQLWNENVSIKNGNLSIYYPENPQLVSRHYPTIYFVSALTKTEQEKLMGLYQQEFQKGLLSPMLFCFLKAKSDSIFINEAIHYMEIQRSARAGRRFKAIWDFQNDGIEMLKQVLIRDKFTFGVFTNSSLSLDEPALEKLISANESNKGNLQLYIDSQPIGNSYVGNGFLHMILREHGFTHDYRVRHQLKDNFSFLLSGFLPALNQVNKRFHH